MLRTMHNALGTEWYKPLEKSPLLAASVNLRSQVTPEPVVSLGREKSSRAKATEMKHDDPGSQPCNGGLCNSTETHSMKLSKSQKGQKGQKLVEQGRNDLRI